MTSGSRSAPSSGDDQGAGSGGAAAVAWDGGGSDLAALREMLFAHAPAGALRMVVQQLTLHEHGKRTGVHEVIDAITDVGGNLVAIPLVEAVRADPVSARLDVVLQRLRSEITAELGTAPDSLEVVIDADGSRQVLLVLAAEVAPAEVSGGSTHPALHDGRHHVLHHAPALDELRDRLAGPPSTPLRRIWDAVTGRLRRSR